MTDPPNTKPKLSRAKSGIGSPGGPLIFPEITVTFPNDLSWEKYLNFGSSPRIVLVRCSSESEKVRVPREYRCHKVALGIDDLPETPTSWFLNQFFSSKLFAFFDLRNQGRIVEEVTDTLLRFSSVVKVVIVIVATDSFGSGIETSLKNKVF